MITLGDLLGNIPIIRQNFEKVVLLIIALSLIPVALQVVAARRSKVNATATH